MFLVPVAFFLSSPAAARVLDPAAPAVDARLEQALAGSGLDLRRSWGSSVEGAGGTFLAPVDGHTHGEQHEQLGLGWVEALGSGELRIVAAYQANLSGGVGDFAAGWANAPVSQRLIVTYGVDDAAMGQQVRDRLERAGYTTAGYGSHWRSAAGSLQPAAAGALYAEAGSRWAVAGGESSSMGLWLESDLLASLPPGSAFPFHKSGYDRGTLTAVLSRHDLDPDSLPIRATDLVGALSQMGAIPGVAAGEPPMRAVPGAHVLSMHGLPGAAAPSWRAQAMEPFQKLPGGIVLGQLPLVGWRSQGVAPAISGTSTDATLQIAGESWQIPGFDASSRAACAAFVADPQDQAAIDVGRLHGRSKSGSGVYAHPSLRDTEIGETLLWSDHMPYAYLGAEVSGRTDRSVIVDRAVRARRGEDGALKLDVDFDVRFYKRGKHDEASLVELRRYTASSEGGFVPSAYVDVAQPDGEHRVLQADAADHGLSADLQPYAKIAAWVSVTRWVVAEGGSVE